MYASVREAMRPGDVIAFGGRSPFSNLIKRFTLSPVSHVGIIRQSQMRTESGARYFNELTESTSLDGRVGVVTSRLSGRLDQYEGEAWWLPLSLATRAGLDHERYFEWLYAQEGKPYDFFGAVATSLEGLPLLGAAVVEDFGRLFCSELAAGALEAAGALPSINASGVTPIELCRFRIYGKCVQLKGKWTTIPRFNTVPPVAA